MITFMEVGRLTIGDVLDRLRTLPNFELAVVAHETGPSSGRVHYHAYVKFTQRTRITGRMVSDAVGIYGHLSVATDRAILYIIKDGNYGMTGIEETDFEAMVGSINNSVATAERRRVAGTTAAQVYDLIKEGNGMDQLLESPFKGYVVTNQGKLEKLISYHKKATIKARDDANRLTFKAMPLEPWARDAVNLRIVKWLNYFFEIKARIAAGQNTKFDSNCHLMIYGHTETGKSRFMEMLGKFVRINRYNYHGAGWQDHWDADAELVYADEFKDNRETSSMTISDWNLLMDANNYQINVRHKDPILHTKMMPVIMITNQNPYRMYCETEDDATRAAWLRRFLKIEMLRGDEIKVFSEHWDKERLSIANFDDDRDLTVKVYNKVTKAPATELVYNMIEEA